MVVSSQPGSSFFSKKWEEVTRKIGINPDKIVYARQTHSNCIRYVVTSGFAGECDSLITNRKPVILSIRVADCIPIFLYASDSDSIGLVHAGWKGTASGITERTVKEMIRRFGSRTESIEVYMGPSIRSCCFKIQGDVSTLFSDKFLRKNKKSGVYLDLQEANRHQLLSYSIKDKNINIDDRCTVCNSEVFFSFRRDGNKAGRMLCIIGHR